MIKSLNVQAPAESHKMESEQTLRSLQRQLDSMREKMRMRQITPKLSKVELSSTRGLVDSGATNPLRPMQDGEDVTAYEDRVVELAAGESYTLRVTPGGTLVAASGTQPIVPMGALVQSLGCRLSWTGGHCKIRHPCRGDLPVAMNQGCPELPMNTALELIKELEEKQMAKLRRLGVNEELEYVKKVVDEHPVFRDVPWHVKKELLVQPAENWKALLGLNRSRRRRLERNGGAAIHLFAGPRDGHDLSRAYRELGGDPRGILEYDIVRSENHDLLSGELMGGLMRLAMDGIPSPSGVTLAASGDPVPTEDDEVPVLGVASRLPCSAFSVLIPSALVFASLGFSATLLAMGQSFRRCSDAPQDQHLIR